MGPKRLNHPGRSCPGVQQQWGAAAPPPPAGLQDPPRHTPRLATLSKPTPARASTIPGTPQGWAPVIAADGSVAGGSKKGSSAALADEASEAAQPFLLQVCGCDPGA